MFKGKYLSILGDSVSTYKGISDDQLTNYTIRKNKYHYEMPFLSCNTYWGILLRELEMELCVNNSHSGGLLCGKDDPTSGLNRAGELSNNDGVDPDYIIVFLGINDYGYYIGVDEFFADYEKTLAIIKEKYPRARVCCVNLPRRSMRSPDPAVEYNNAIARAVKGAGEGYFVADFYGSEMSGDNFFANTHDDLHPNENGMRLIADFIIKSFKENVK